MKKLGERVSDQKLNEHYYPLSYPPRVRLWLEVNKFFNWNL